MEKEPNGSKGFESGRARSLFLSHVRHELRTPLNAIIGYSEMLIEDGVAGAACTADLERINLAGRNLLVIANELIDPSADHSGESDQESLTTFAERIHHQMRTPLNTIIGYSEMVVEELQEQDESEGAIADVERIATAGRTLLSLIDDIITFSRSDLSAFDIEEKGGDISAMIREVATTLGPRQKDAPKSRGGHILLVDDNEVNRDMLSRRLAREGHHPESAASGRLAIEALREKKFDLVLLDVMMPEMNGYQVLEYLKEDAALRDIPVIMISALDEIESVVRCIEAGAEDYLPKPFDPVLLRARISASLEKKWLRDHEVEYLRNVSILTSAALAIERETFEAECVAEVVTREDELGRLARVFQKMAHEIYLREKRLKEEVQQLRIEIDEAKKSRQVAEITESDYFRQLRAKAQEMRDKS